MSILRSGIHPHPRPLALRSLLLQPVPLFTRARDGCRPYAEIYSNGALVFSTKRPEYEENKLYDMMEGKACLILGDATVRGDVTIVVFHARQQLGRVIGIKIASLHFHTGYVPLTESTLNFEKKDLDDAPEVGGKFKIILNVMIGEENPKITRIPAPWEIEASRDHDLMPDPLFGSTLEMEETLENFRTINPSQSSSRRASIPIVEHEPLVEQTTEPDDPIEVVEDIEETPQKRDETFYEADLLNLGMPGGDPDNLSSSAPANPGLDIFGGFASFNQPAEESPELFGNIPANNGKVGDLLFDRTEKTEKSGDFLFDPFGNSTNLLGNFGNSGRATTGLKSPSEDSFPRNSSVPNFAAQNKDPFANLAGSLSAGLNASWNGTPRDSNTPQSASPATAGTPVHSSPRMQNKTANPPPTNDIGNPIDGAVLNNKPPTKTGDAFEDLLGSQGYNFFSSRKAEKDSPKTINQMRKVEQAKTMDPDKLKVSEWTEGKKSNLRALLCSLHTVLWPEADRWQRYEMHQLVSPADVKKAYRKACLAVHPDKVNLII